MVAAVICDCGTTAMMAVVTENMVVQTGRRVCWRGAAGPGPW